MATAPAEGSGTGRAWPSPRSEQPVDGVVQASQHVVVHDRAADPAVEGQHPRLRLDLLGGEDPAHGSQKRVAVEQIEIARELLDAVDLAPALDLDGYRGADGVATHQVDRA